MFLISSKCENKYRIKNELGLIYDKNVITFNNNDILKKTQYKDLYCVITDDNKKNINYFNDGKRLIVVMTDNKPETKKIKNIYYCSNIDEIRSAVTMYHSKHNFKIRTIEIICIVLLLIGLITLGCHIMNNNKITIAKDNKKVEDKTSKKYVFLGDSITEFYHLEDYYDDSLQVINSGISGDKTYDILDDLEQRVFKYKPSIVFLQVGTNDLSNRTDREIVNNIADITRLIHKNLKDTKIYVESIYPVNNNTEGNDIVIDWMVGDRDNERIRSINKEIKKNSKEYGYTYIDFYSVLEDDNKSLKLEYTVDGLHLSDEGYKAITKEIMKIIDEDNKEE